jgi:hypothetical protein
MMTQNTGPQGGGTHEHVTNFLDGDGWSTIHGGGIISNTNHFVMKETMPAQEECILL